MNVKETANRLGVTSDTVRFYTRIGYLEPKRNPGNGYKEYEEGDVTRLRFILNARHLGFSVEDIGLVLDRAEHGDTPCPLVRDLMEARLREAQRRYRETGRLLKRMQRALGDWKSVPDTQPTGRHICHLIEDFDFSP